jgi:ribose 5-phosphate isomerase B
MRVVIGSDDDAPIVDEVARLFAARGYEVVRLPTSPWGRVATLAGEAVASGRADQAVVLCFTGTGVAMAANKVRGVRAALSVDAATAAGARKWNDANVLALSLRLLTASLAHEIVEAWVGTVYAGTESESLGVMAGVEHSP